MITDVKIDPRSGVAVKRIRTPLVVAAVSLTDRAFGVFRPGFAFRITGMELWSMAVTGAVSAGAVIIRNGTGIITATAITVHSTPTQFAVAACKALVANTVVEKAAASGLTFTAAHVVTANLFGVVLIQMSNAGAISTKVPLATQAYVTAADAIAALPAADANRVALGYIVIANNAGDWVANTDNMTAAGGVTSVTLVNNAARAKACAVTPFSSAASVVVAPSTTLADVIGRATDTVVMLYTSDGTGALQASSHADIAVRAFPHSGELFPVIP